VFTARPRGRAEAIEEYLHAFRAAIGRRVRVDAVIGLSGGADSRHILLELVRIGCRPGLALTVDLPGLEDADIARRLAARCGVAHHVLAPSDGPADEVRKCALVDFMSLQHRWFMAVADHIEQRAWWDGIGGDVLSAGLFLEAWNLELMQAGRFETYAERLVPPGGVYWFGPEARFSRDQAIHDVAEELRLHADAANPVGSFFFWNRTCVDIAASPFGIMARRGITVLAPYLDQQVWECLMSVPADMMLDHQFHVQVIRTAHPEMADLPYARKRQVHASVHRRRARAALPMLWRQWSREPRATTLKAIAHAARSSITGRGDPGGLMEHLVYANALHATMERHAVHGHRGAGRDDDTSDGSNP
jgi:hypothetical protein